MVNSSIPFAQTEGNGDLAKAGIPEIRDGETGTVWNQGVLNPPLSDDVTYYTKVSLELQFPSISPKMELVIPLADETDVAEESNLAWRV